MFFILCFLIFCLGIACFGYASFIPDIQSVIFILGILLVALAIGLPIHRSRKEHNTGHNW